MKFLPTSIAGVYVIEVERRPDPRGHFARTWCRQEFAEAGLTATIAQSNVSFNLRKGTLRGMHWQTPPHAEAKLIRCTRGRIYDVVADVRPGSSTHRRWIGVELTPTNDRLLYVPEGCAHGFQTLEDGTEVTYHVSAVYTPSAERGLRFDDPAFDIRWPEQVTVVSDKDQAWPPYEAATSAPVGSEQRAGAWSW